MFKQSIQKLLIRIIIKINQKLNSGNNAKKPLDPQEQKEFIKLKVFHIGSNHNSQVYPIRFCDIHLKKATDIIYDTSVNLTFSKNVYIKFEFKQDIKLFIDILKEQSKLL